MDKIRLSRRGFILSAGGLAIAPVLSVEGEGPDQGPRHGVMVTARRP